MNATPNAETTNPQPNADAAESPLASLGFTAKHTPTSVFLFSPRIAAGEAMQRLASMLTNAAGEDAETRAERMREAIAGALLPFRSLLGYCVEMEQGARGESRDLRNRVAQLQDEIEGLRAEIAREHDRARHAVEQFEDARRELAAAEARRDRAIEQAERAQADAAEAAPT